MLSNQDSVPLAIAAMLCSASASGRLPSLWHPFPLLTAAPMPDFYLCCGFPQFSESAFSFFFFLLRLVLRSEKHQDWFPGRSPVTAQTSAPDRDEFSLFLQVLSIHNSN